jgi:diadenosine tetraphosphate (Ap4A) HIT family hydrolase
MVLIFETRSFTVEAPDKPLMTRSDGGHIKIVPKARVQDRQQLAPRQAIELMRLTMVVGEAMTTVLRRSGIDIGRINYHDDGNWTVFLPDGPYLHIHLFGRAKDAKIQPYGEAVHHPLRSRDPEFYEKNKPLTAEDVLEICKEIEEIFERPEYADAVWGLDRP